MNPLEEQVGGDHYKKLGAYQPWEVLAKWLTPDELRGYAKGTVVAYLARERDKGGMADIEKAAHVLQIYLHLATTPDPAPMTNPCYPCTDHWYADKNSNCAAVCAKWKAWEDSRR